MESKHLYSILMVSVFFVFFTFLLFGFYKVIEAFATGEWDMTASITALLTLIITIVLSHVVSKTLDNRFSTYQFKRKVKEEFKVELVEVIGNILADIDREDNTKKLYVLSHKAILLFNDELSEKLSKIINNKKVTSSEYKEIINMVKKL